MSQERFVRPEFIAPHYSTKLWRAYYHYLVSHYDKSVFSQVCDELGVPVEYLLKDGNWVSNEFTTLFMTKLKEKTKDPDIAERVGEFTLHPDNINPFEHAILQAMPPTIFFLSFPFEAAKVNQFLSFKISKFRPGKIVYRIVPKHDERPDSDVCKNACGVLSSTQGFYGLNHVRIDHSECVHNGAQECVFEVRYDASPYWKRIFIGIGALATFGYLLQTLLIGDEESTKNSNLLSFLFFVSYSLAAALAVTFAKTRKIILHNVIHHEQNRIKQQSLYESRRKLDRRYHESNLMRDLSLRLVRLTHTKDVIKSCVDEVSRRFGYERILVMLVSQENQCLYSEDVRGFGEESERLYAFRFAYPARTDNPQIFANILERGQTIFVEQDKLPAFKESLRPENRKIVESIGVNSLIVAPIQDSQEKYGILVVGSIGRDRYLTDDDRHLLENIARMLSLFFQNARNFENEQTLRSLFQKYVPPVVLESVNALKTEGRKSLTPKNNAVTSMFIDLRGFTAVSELLQPERVIDMLNIYAEFVTKEIAALGGIVDNLIGDGVVAFFPAESDRRTIHAEKALVAAINILGKIDNLSASFRERGYPEPHIGIGLHSGNAIVGNVGSDLKLNYTAIGDTINLASRLQDQCKEFKSHADPAATGMAIVSEEVLKRAALPISLKPLGQINVRGRVRSVEGFLIDSIQAKQILEAGGNGLSPNLDATKAAITLPANIGDIKERRKVKKVA